MKGTYFTNHAGDRDYMSKAEMDAVEKTGRCSVEKYAHTPTEWVSQDYKVLALHARPGQVEPGTRPPHFYVPESKLAKTFDQMEKGSIHWKSHGRSVCDNSNRAGAMYAGPEFARLSASERRCVACGELYATLTREGMKWSVADVILLKRMWKHWDKREDCARMLKRTVQSCIFKWGHIR
jgi:hypothetical protein